MSLKYDPKDEITLGDTGLDYGDFGDTEAV